jgi:hypothetical protein
MAFIFLLAPVLYCRQYSTGNTYKIFVIDLREFSSEVGNMALLISGVTSYRYEFALGQLHWRILFNKIPLITVRILWWC